MAGSLEQITQNLAALDQKIKALQETFHTVYTSYLAALGQAVRQQIILSSYHIATENHPHRFLALSAGQRQQFQDDLRELAQLTQQDIENLLRSLEPPSEDELLELDAELEIDDELEALLQEMPGSDSQEPPTEIEELTQWQANVERSIVKTLQSASQATNRLLQHAEILPKRVPSPILDAAAQAEGGEPTGTPSILSLLVEAREKSSDEESSKAPIAALMHIIAVNLRLAEIEFNDPTVMSWRNKLRDLKKQLQILAREYQKKQRDHAIAQARLAWKATWVDE